MKYIQQLINTTLLSAALLLSSAVTLNAQQKKDAEQDTIPSYELSNIIISANRTQEDPSSVGRNVTVIDQQEINQSVQSSVGQLLSNKQSLHVVGTRQTPGSNQSLFMRHSNGNHATVMINGMRVSDPSSVSNSIDLTELSLVGVQRIEIVRGSHSTLYGSSAIGGVINIITEGRSNTGLNGSIQTSNGTFGGSTFTTDNRLFLNYSSAEGWYGNLGVYQEYTKGIDATIDTVGNPNAFNPQDQDNFEKIDLTGKVGYKTEKWDIFASYRREDQSTDLDDGAFSDDDNAYIDFQRSLFNYNASHQLAKNLEVQFKGGYSTLDRDFVDDSSLVNSAGTYDHTFTETHSEGTLWENELSATFSLQSATIIAGVNRNVQTMNTRTFTHISSFGYRNRTNLDSLNLEEEINSAFLLTTLNGGLISNALSNVELTLGGRYSDHNTFGSHFTYEINPTVHISPRTTVYGAITTGFNAPSLFQLHAPQKQFGAHTTRGNSNLDPETSLSYEVGWKQQFGENINLNLSLFKTRVSNVVEYVYLWNKNTAVNNLGFGDYLGDTYINVSKQDMQGVELGWKFPLNPQIDISGNLSYIQSTLTFEPEDINTDYTGGHHVQIFESGKFVNGTKELEGLTRRPEFSGSIHIDYRPTSALSVGLSTQYIDDRKGIFFAQQLGPFGALDRTSIKGGILTDIEASYQITPRLTVSSTVKNLFDEEYTDIRGYNTRGRSVYGKIRYSF